MKDKIAIPLDGQPSIMLLSNGERMTREKALKAGYRIADARSVAQSDGGNTLSAWRSHVTNLPEARDRPSAAAQLIESQPLMSIERVRSFLRGLPTEQQEDNQSVTTENQDPRSARLAEIGDTMRAFNKNRGFATKPKAAPSVASIEPMRLRRLAEIRLAALNVSSAEHKKLAYALQVQDQTGAPLTNVFAQLGVNTSKIIPST